MSKIPYCFDTPVPKYFREAGWFKNPKMMVFIHWAFARCSIEKRTVYHIQKAVELDSFEFIFGRRVCSEETGLTEREIRTCIEQLSDQQKTGVNAKMLKKSTSKTTNKYTVYKWSIELFCKNNAQQKDQQTTSRRPADDHNQEDKKKKNKRKNPPLPPPFFDLPKTEDSTIDDLSSFLKKEEIEECVKKHGSRERVLEIISSIEASGQAIRTTWKRTILGWTLHKVARVNVSENKKFGLNLEIMYDNPLNAWRLRHSTDIKNKKEGTLFEVLKGQSTQTHLVYYADPNYKEMVLQLIQEKKMKKIKETVN